MKGALDAHMHLFRYGFNGMREDGEELSDFESLHAANGIEGALVVGFEGLPRFKGNNRYIGEIAKTRPWIHGLYYLDSAHDPGPKVLTSARANGFVGFSLYLDGPESTFDQWDKETLAVLGKDSTIVSINASPAAIERNEAVLAGLPAAAVLVSHLGLPEPGALSTDEAGMRLRPLLQMVRYRNIYVKVSGLYAIEESYPHACAAPYLEVLLDSFGIDRMLWGSDYSPVEEFCRPSEYLSLPPWCGELAGVDDMSDVLARNLRELLRAARPVEA